MRTKIWGVVTLSATVALGGLLSATETAQAAPGAAGKAGRGQRGGGMMGEGLAKVLGLTEAQKTKLKAVMEGAKTRGAALKANTSLSPEQKRAQARQLRETTQSEIAAILTPEQFQKLEELKQKRQAGRQNGGQKKPGSKRGQVPA